MLIIKRSQLTQSFSLSLSLFGPQWCIFPLFPFSEIGRRRRDGNFGDKAPASSLPAPFFSAICHPTRGSLFSPFVLLPFLIFLSLFFSWRNVPSFAPPFYPSPLFLFPIVPLLQWKSQWRPWSPRRATLFRPEGEGTLCAGKEQKSKILKVQINLQK